MFRRTFSAFTLIAALGAPVLLSSTVAAQSLDVRIYDRSHKDYHTWNADEDRTYRQYLTDNHRPYRALNRQSKKQQAEYWKWRHDRP
jgi:hypothetical protein